MTAAPAARRGGGQRRQRWRGRWLVDSALMGSIRPRSGQGATGAVYTGATPGMPGIRRPIQRSPMAVTTVTAPPAGRTSPAVTVVTANGLCRVSWLLVVTAAMVVTAVPVGRW